MKVVVNHTPGGFALSKEAINLLARNLEVTEDEIKSRGDWHLQRHDPTLVRLVEDLGPRASARGSFLEIENFPSEGYQIQGRPGYETIGYSV